MDEKVINIIGAKRWERIQREAGNDADCIGRALLILNERFDIKDALFGCVDLDWELKQRRLNLTLKLKECTPFA